MHKITKYITTGAAAMLLLMSVGAVQTNANAARHYRAHVTRNAKYNVRRNKQNRRGRKDQSRNKQNQNSNQVQNKNQKAKTRKISKQNKKTVKNAKRRYRRNARKHNVKRNKRAMNRYAKRINRRNRRGRRSYKGILKPRYRVANSRNTKRDNRALIKAGFYDGKLLSEMPGSAFTNSNFIFCKYAPNDKRAVIPSYMNPKDAKFNKKFHVAGYHNINSDFWIQTNFSLSNPQNATKHPKVYKYNNKLHGWQLAKQF